MVNTFKTILALAALGASAYAVFLTINQRPFSATADRPGENNPDNLQEVQVETGTPISGESLPFLEQREETIGPRAASPTDLVAGEEGSLPPATVLASPETSISERQQQSGPPNSVPAMASQSPTNLQPERQPAAASLAPMSFPEALQQSEALLTQRQLYKALRLLSDFYDWESSNRLSDSEYQTLINLVDQLAGTVIYSPEPWLEDSRYEIQPGDSLQTIAQTYQVPWQLLAKINGISEPGQLAPGSAIKVIPGPFEAVVDLEKLRLTLRLQGCYAGRFSLGVGQDYLPPFGEFRIAEKVFNPVYRGPGGVIVRADDPTNPYGAVWLDLGNGYGLHGTSNPNTIGRVGGAGCLRCSPRDIADLADILSVGSKVTILRGSQVPVAERRNTLPPNRNFGPR